MVLTLRLVIVQFALHGVTPSSFSTWSVEINCEDSSYSTVSKTIELFDVDKSIADVNGRHYLKALLELTTRIFQRGNVQW